MQDQRLNNLYTNLNNKLFGGELPSVWNGNFELIVDGRLTRSYGSCHWRLNSNGTFNHKIKIARSHNKWLSDGSPFGSLVHTLVHEMVHLYMNINKSPSAAHGHRWQSKMLEVSKTYDGVYNNNNRVMYNAAKTQIDRQYKNTREKNIVIVNNRVVKKYSMTCECCGWTRSFGRLTRNFKAAAKGQIPHVMTGSSCLNPMKIVQNW